VPKGILKTKIKSKSSTIIINYCIIVNAYDNYINNAQYNYNIANKDLFEECDKEENVTVTGAATTSCLKNRLKNLLANVTYSPNHSQDGAPVINFQATLRTAPDLCTNVSLAVIFGSNGNSYISIYSQIYTHTHPHTSQYRDGGRAKEIKIWGNSECRMP